MGKWESEPKFGASASGKLVPVSVEQLLGESKEGQVNENGRKESRSRQRKGLVCP